MPAAERKQRIEEALGRVGLASRIKHYPAELSGGQQQRVAIARALAGSPRLLLADEPTGNLDSLMARGVMELLEEINRQGTTIVMVTHDPELAARAQRNVHVIDGQVTDFDEEPSLRKPMLDDNGPAPAIATKFRSEKSRMTLSERFGCRMPSRVGDFPSAALAPTPESP